jgi:hypothetical protein
MCMYMYSIYSMIEGAGRGLTDIQGKDIDFTGMLCMRMRMGMSMSMSMYGYIWVCMGMYGIGIGVWAIGIGRSVCIVHIVCNTYSM